MNFRKSFMRIASAFLIAVSMSGCQNSNNKTSDKLSIVCTTFPEYDWVKEIIGSHADNIDVTYLLENGTDIHNYQPTANDIIKISECDMLVYIGGESDNWVDNVLSNANNKDMKVVNLMESMSGNAKEEEVKEGMQSEEHEDDHNSQEHETEYDEHFWLSLRNSKMLCNEICSTLCEIDESNAGDYKSNLNTYTQKLNELDSDFRELFDNSNVKTLIFGDRFPFRYFTDDYNLDYYAAFVGCSAETEASFETISFLAQKTDELNADTIFTIENSDKSIANAIIQNTKNKNQNIRELNSIQSVSSEMISDGTTYLSLMKSNYDVLQEVLN